MDTLKILSEEYLGKHSRVKGFLILFVKMAMSLFRAYQMYLIFGVKNVV